MRFNDCLDYFLTYVRSYASADTIAYYDLNMRFFRDFLADTYNLTTLDINELKKTDYVAYISYQRSRGVKNVSVRTYARAVKSFLRYCYNEGYLLENITYNVRFPKDDSRIVFPLSAQVVARLVSAIGGRSVLRDTLIFRLMLDCGLRKSEVLSLKWTDVDMENRLLYITNSKNNKSRVLPLPTVILEILEKMDSVAIFVITDKNGNKVTSACINKIFTKLKKIYNVYPHLLRHTFATSFILGGGSLEVLRVLLGHSDYNVTKNYIHIAKQCEITNFDIYKLDDIYFKAYNYRH